VKVIGPETLPKRNGVNSRCRSETLFILRNDRGPERGINGSHSLLPIGLLAAIGTSMLQASENHQIGTYNTFSSSSHKGRASIVVPTPLHNAVKYVSSH
jgi:hypothetical protein